MAFLAGVFFSSRSRHTRFDCDWSSDVCSSDLRVFDDRGYFVSKKLQQRFKYDFDKVREILFANGLADKWEAILDADEAKLKIILKELPSPIRQQISDQRVLSKEFIVLTSSLKPAKLP